MTTWSAALLIADRLGALRKRGAPFLLDAPDKMKKREDVIHENGH